jgi:hypothetical protein
VLFLLQQNKHRGLQRHANLAPLYVPACQNFKPQPHRHLPKAPKIGDQIAKAGQTYGLVAFCSSLTKLKLKNQNVKLQIPPPAETYILHFDI